MMWHEPSWSAVTGHYHHPHLAMGGAMMAPPPPFHPLPPPPMLPPPPPPSWVMHRGGRVGGAVARPWGPGQRASLSPGMPEGDASMNDDDDDDDEGGLMQRLHDDEGYGIPPHILMRRMVRAAMGHRPYGGANPPAAAVAGLPPPTECSLCCACPAEENHRRTHGRGRRPRRAHPRGDISTTRAFTWADDDDDADPNVVMRVYSSDDSIGGTSDPEAAMGLMDQQAWMSEESTDQDDEPSPPRREPSQSTEAAVPGRAGMGSGVHPPAGGSGGGSTVSRQGWLPGGRPTVILPPSQWGDGLRTLGLEPSSGGAPRHRQLQRRDQYRVELHGHLLACPACNQGFCRRCISTYVKTTWGEGSGDHGASVENPHLRCVHCQAALPVEAALGLMSYRARRLYLKTLRRLDEARVYGEAQLLLQQTFGELIDVVAKEAIEAALLGHHDHVPDASPTTPLVPHAAEKNPQPRRGVRGRATVTTTTTTGSGNCDVKVDPPIASQPPPSPIVLMTAAKVNAPPPSVPTYDAADSVVQRRALLAAAVRTAVIKAVRLPTALQEAQFSRLFVGAKMCPRCRHGPILVSGCDDLQQHHGEVVASGGTRHPHQLVGHYTNFARVIASSNSNSAEGEKKNGSAANSKGPVRYSNACPQCGHLTANKQQLLPWDGKTAPDCLATAAAAVAATVPS